jgi:hypothetical protein
MSNNEFEDDDNDITDSDELEGFDPGDEEDDDDDENDAFHYEHDVE